MSQAGRDECQTFPVATLNNNEEQSRHGQSKITPTLIPRTMLRLPRADIRLWHPEALRLESRLDPRAN
jgi:hypothetical protein